MRLLLKFISLPFILITWVLYGVCRLLVLVSGVILGILSGITLVAAAVLFFKAGVLPGVGGVADGEDRRYQLCLAGFSRKLNQLCAGRFGVPLLFWEVQNEISFTCLSSLCKLR